MVDKPTQQEKTPVGLNPEVQDLAVEFAPGRVIAGQFEVIRLLGQGGMGVVHEVADRVTKQRLALKTLLPGVLRGPEAEKRFIYEVNIGRRLRHPNIAGIYDVRRDGDLLFYTMEYVEGRTLRAMLDETGPLTLKTAISILERICGALEYAHEFAVHRDLCPSNVMILPDGGVRILDFGISLSLESQDTTSSDGPGGKKHYIAPEQLEDPDKVDGRADVYALGAMFHEMLSGSVLSPYRSLRELRPDLPVTCERVIARAVAPLPKRYQDVKQFWAAVRGCSQDSDGTATTKNTAHAPPREKDDPQGFVEADDLWMMHSQMLPGKNRKFWIRVGIITGVGLLLVLLLVLMM